MLKASITYRQFSVWLPLVRQLVLLLLSAAVKAQSDIFTHYTTDSRLPGTNVYDICQDQDHFMWFATEFGLSRFDGSAFRNFSVSEGLSGNEILKIYADKKNRIWTAPFNKTISFVLNGVVHNRENDTIVRNIKLKSDVQFMAENDAGDLIVCESDKIHHISHRDEISLIDKGPENEPLHIYAVSKNRHGGFWLVSNSGLYQIKGRMLTKEESYQFYSPHPSTIAISPSYFVFRSSHKNTTLVNLNSGYTKKIPHQDLEHVNYTIINDSMLSVNQNVGCKIYNLHSEQIILMKHYLDGQPTTSVLVDKDGAYWIGTNNNGVFKFQAGVTQEVLIKSQSTVAIDHIFKASQSFLAGATDNTLLKINLEKQSATRCSQIPLKVGIVRLIYGEQLDNDKLLLINSSGITVAKSRTYIPIDSIFGLTPKAVLKEMESTYLIATNKHLLRFDVDKMKISDTLWRNRSTNVLKSGDTLYIGTINGLVVLKSGQNIASDFWPSKVLAGRITDIKKDMYGRIWISSYEYGIVCMDNSGQLTELNKKNGLSSDIIKAIVPYGNKIFLATDKGVNVIQKKGAVFHVKYYDSEDGLNSDFVNCIYPKDDSTLLLGTNKGLSILHLSSKEIPWICKVVLERITINSNAHKKTEQSISILTNDKLQLDFSVVSLRHNKNIVIESLVEGIDSGWRQLSYPQLVANWKDPGDYHIKIRVRNKNGEQSDNLVLHVLVAARFWQTKGFYLLASLAAFGVVFTGVWLYLNNRAKKKTQQLEAEKKYAELENMAFRARMNPHFIFNCLSSIQQFVLEKNVKEANQFISDFSFLIRKSLEFTNKTTINLKEEIEYLSRYLSVEQMRLGEKMEYEVIVDQDLKQANPAIFSMLIQPFVENAIRHGIRHLKMQKGVVRLHFKSRSDSWFEVIIEDNGVGIQRADDLNKANLAKPEGQGLKIIYERINFLNKMYDTKIGFEVGQLDSTNEEQPGTIVKILFPIL
jgi:ligand-binding sensor domain-containing protein/two-component sensor histidine kinase